jgi:hypothetical protein
VILVTFDLMKGLQKLVPGAKVSGVFKDQTVSEYNNLKWLDPREKPTYQEVEASTLRVMRQDWRSAINERTVQIIEDSMVFNDGSKDENVTLGVEEQINAIGMILTYLIGEMTSTDYLSAAGVNFPYSLKVSDNENGEGNYINLSDKTELIRYFLSGVGHKNNAIESGRLLKDSLGTMNRTQLEEFRDER